MKQVITIGPDGSISGLQRKRGQGVNLQALGHARTERVSEIKWSEDKQAWFVLPIQGPFSGKPLTKEMWAEHLPERSLPEGFDQEDHWSPEDVILFADYDDAVKAEIAFLDAARRRGHF